LASPAGRTASFSHRSSRKRSARTPRVELVDLSAHEGVDGYRGRSLGACREPTADLDISHGGVSYDEEFDVRMDDVVGEDPHDMSVCVYCGCFGGTCEAGTQPTSALTGF